MKGFKSNFDTYIKNDNADQSFESNTHELNKDTELEIFDIQAEKKHMVEQMHELLQKADAGKEVSFSKNARSIEEIDGKMYYFKKGGERAEATKGDIMVSGINGFDLKLSEAVDKTTKKEFIVRETRRKIQDLYNKQLLLAELKNDLANERDGGLKAYEAISEMEETKPYETKKAGLLVETMIHSHLTKLFIDNPHLPITFEAADVYEDVRNKIDFKIHIKKEYTRGLSVKSHMDAGIQFTMNTSKTEVKENQIKHSKKYLELLDEKPVDDILLVSLPIDEVNDTVQSWKDDGKNKSIGGPTEKWTLETKKLVFTKMLEKLPDTLNINPEEWWNSLNK